jgi:uncharacterized protein with PQ loop repeat
MSAFFETLGWIGNIILSIGVIPQVYKTWRTHDVSSFSWSFLLMWWLGVILAFTALVYQNLVDKHIYWSFWVNYLINIFGTTYLVYAKLKYGKSNINSN